MIASLVVCSQQANYNFEAETVNLSANSPSANILSTSSNSNSSLTPIWSEDFSGGFPALWSTSTSNMSGAFATCPWEWTTDGTWGYYNGNQGTSGSNAITSSTANNGFLICDTDSQQGNYYHYLSNPLLQL